MGQSLPPSVICTQGTPSFAKRSPFFTVMQTEMFNTLDF
jgi:hypothetical protein